MPVRGLVQQVRMAEQRQGEVVELVVVLLRGLCKTRSMVERAVLQLAQRQREERVALHQAVLVVLVVQILVVLVVVVVGAQAEQRLALVVMGPPVVVVVVVVVA